MYWVFVNTLWEAERADRKPIRWEIPSAWVRAMEICNHHPYAGNAEKLRTSRTLIGIPVVEISNTEPARLVLEISKEDSLPLVD